MDGSDPGLKTAIRYVKSFKSTVRSDFLHMARRGGRGGCRLASQSVSPEDKTLTVQIRTMFYFKDYALFIGRPGRPGLTLWMEPTLIRRSENSDCIDVGETSW